jgi:hypothetical protein
LAIKMARSSVLNGTDLRSNSFLRQSMPFTPTFSLNLAQVEFGTGRMPERAAT